MGGLFGVRTTEDLRALEPRDAVARHLHGIDLRWRWRRHIDETKQRHPRHADAIEAERDRPGSGWTDQVLGAVEHGDVAWVLHVGGVDDLRDYSLRGGGVRIVTLVREDREWRVADDLHPGYLTALGPLRIRAADGTHLFLE